MWSASAVLNFPLPLHTGQDCGNNSCCVSVLPGKKNAADMSGTRGDERRDD